MHVLVPDPIPYVTLLHKRFQLVLPWLSENTIQNLLFVLQTLFWKKKISWLILGKVADRNQEGKEQKGKKPSFLTCDPAAIVGAKYCRMKDPPELWAHGEPGGHAIQERFISQGHPTPTTQMDVEAGRSSLSEEQDIAEFVSEILQLWNWCLSGEGRFLELNARCDTGLYILVLPLSSARSCFTWAVDIYRVIFPVFLLLWSTVLKGKK